MTICIGALAERGKYVVVATDRMVTGEDVEFEQDALKLEWLCGKYVALLAGSALDPTDLLRAASATLADRTAPTVKNTVEVIKDEFLRLRKQRAEEQYLKPLGLDLDSFLANQSRLTETLVLRLNRNLEEASIDLQILIGGVDGNGGHLYLIYDPGTSRCFDAIGFCCIGSGEHHAQMTLIRNGYSPARSLNQVVYLVYEAKRRAEVAPGVGSKFTDLAILSENQPKLLGPEDLKWLEDLYAQKSQAELSALDGIAESLRQRVLR